jgi:phospholipid transport system substrate-binding protein
VAFFFVAGTPSVRAGTTDDIVAKQLVQTVVSDALRDFGGRNLGPEERSVKLAALIEHYGDMSIYSEIVLGRYWTRASLTERTDFEKLLGQYLLGCWTSPLRDMPSRLRIDFATTEVLANGRLVIHSLAVVPTDTLALDWTIAHSADGRLVIADVAIDGASAFQTMKSDFLSILHANGGRLEALIAALRRKVGNSPD